MRHPEKYDHQPLITADTPWRRTAPADLLAESAWRRCLALHIGVHPLLEDPHAWGLHNAYAPFRGVHDCKRSSALSGQICKTSEGVNGWPTSHLQPARHCATRRPTTSSSPACQSQQPRLPTPACQSWHQLPATQRRCLPPDAAACHPPITRLQTPHFAARSPAIYGATCWISALCYAPCYATTTSLGDCLPFRYAQIDHL